MPLLWTSQESVRYPEEWTGSEWYAWYTRLERRSRRRALRRRIVRACTRMYRTGRYMLRGYVYPLVGFVLVCLAVYMFLVMMLAS